MFKVGTMLHCHFAERPPLVDSLFSRSIPTCKTIECFFWLHIQFAKKVNLESFLIKLTRTLCIQAAPL
jgi:hypothetical protein